ncbi:hypothetical protein ACYJW8_02720 [Frateuria aurantia]
MGHYSLVDGQVKVLERSKLIHFKLEGEDHAPVRLVQVAGLSPSDLPRYSLGVRVLEDRDLLLDFNQGHMCLLTFSQLQ